MTSTAPWAFTAFAFAAGNFKDLPVAPARGVLTVPFVERKLDTAPAVDDLVGPGREETGKVEEDNDNEGDEEEGRGKREREEGDEE